MSLPDICFSHRLKKESKLNRKPCSTNEKSKRSCFIFFTCGAVHYSRRVDLFELFTKKLSRSALPCFTVQSEISGYKLACDVLFSTPYQLVSKLGCDRRGRYLACQLPHECLSVPRQSGLEHYGFPSHLCQLGSAASLFPSY